MAHSKFARENFPHIENFKSIFILKIQFNL